MEISIKWNICRVCLQEELNSSGSMKYIFNDTRLAKQISECSGIELSPNDGLPEKLCRKCLYTLKYAILFRNTCRKSDEYLKSVMQKAKAATILNPDKENEILADDLDDVIEELDDGSGEFVYIIADAETSEVEEVKLLKRNRDTHSDDNTNNKSTKLSKSMDVISTEDRNIHIIKQGKYNLEDLAKFDDVYMRNDNCYSVEIVPEDPLTSLMTVEEDEATQCRKKNKKNSSEFINIKVECSSNNDASNNFEEIGENNDKCSEEYLNDNEDYTEQETQEEAVKSHNEESNDGYIPVQICNESSQDAEYILGEDELQNSDYILSSEDDVPKNKATLTRRKRLSNNGLEKKIIANNKKVQNTEPVSLICDHCGNQFSNRSTLTLHIRNLHKERPFECELCSKAFAAPSNLSAHMRTHTGERRYECQYCQRRFTDRSTHIKHERIHTNEKPFKCETCQKAFSLSTSLKAHIRIHTGEKPFECKLCKKAFKLPHQLKAHLNTLLHKQVELEANPETDQKA